MICSIFESCLSEVTQIVRSKYRGIEIYEAKINLEEFKLDIIPVL